MAVEKNIHDISMAFAEVKNKKFIDIRIKSSKRPGNTIQSTRSQIQQGGSLAAATPQNAGHIFKQPTTQPQDKPLSWTSANLVSAKPFNQRPRSDGECGHSFYPSQGAVVPNGNEKVGVETCIAASDNTRCSKLCACANSPACNCSKVVDWLSSQRRYYLFNNHRQSTNMKSCGFSSDLVSNIVDQHSRNKLSHVGKQRVRLASARKHTSRTSMNSDFKINFQKMKFLANGLSLLRLDTTKRTKSKPPDCDMCCFYGSEWTDGPGSSCSALVNGCARLKQIDKLKKKILPRHTQNALEANNKKLRVMLPESATKWELAKEETLAGHGLCPRLRKFNGSSSRPRTVSEKHNRVYYSLSGVAAPLNVRRSNSSIVNCRDRRHPVKESPVSCVKNTTPCSAFYEFSNHSFHNNDSMDELHANKMSNRNGNNCHRNDCKYEDNSNNNNNNSNNNNRSEDSDGDTTYSSNNIKNFEQKKLDSFCGPFLPHNAQLIGSVRSVDVPLFGDSLGHCYNVPNEIGDQGDKENEQYCLAEFGHVQSGSSESFNKQSSSVDCGKKVNMDGSYVKDNHSLGCSQPDCVNHEEALLGSRYPVDEYRQHNIENVSGHSKENLWFEGTNMSSSGNRQEDMATCRSWSTLPNMSPVGNRQEGMVSLPGCGSVQHSAYPMVGHTDSFPESRCSNSSTSSHHLHESNHTRDTDCSSTGDRINLREYYDDQRAGLDSFVPSPLNSSGHSEGTFTAALYRLQSDGIQANTVNAHSLFLPVLPSIPIASMPFPLLPQMPPPLMPLADDSLPPLFLQLVSQFYFESFLWVYQEVLFNPSFDHTRSLLASLSRWHGQTVEDATLSLLSGHMTGLIELQRLFIQQALSVVCSVVQHGVVDTHMAEQLRSQAINIGISLNARHMLRNFIATIKDVFNSVRRQLQAACPTTRRRARDRNTLRQSESPERRAFQPPSMSQPQAAMPQQQIHPAVLPHQAPHHHPFIIDMTQVPVSTPVTMAPYAIPVCTAAHHLPTTGHMAQPTWTIPGCTVQFPACSIQHIPACGLPMAQHLPQHMQPVHMPPHLQHHPNPLHTTHFVPTTQHLQGHHHHHQENDIHVIGDRRPGTYHIPSAIHRGPTINPSAPVLLQEPAVHPQPHDVYGPYSRFVRRTPNRTNRWRSVPPPPPYPGLLLHFLAMLGNPPVHGAYRMELGEEAAGVENYEALLHLAERLGEAKSRGLTKAEIEMLPSYRFTSDNRDPTADQTSCVVCMCDFEPRQLLRVLPCAHEFHGKCVDKWLKTNRTCPICRADASETASSQSD